MLLAWWVLPHAFFLVVGVVGVVGVGGVHFCPSVWPPNPQFTAALQVGAPLCVCCSIWAALPRALPRCEKLVKCRGCLPHRCLAVPDRYLSPLLLPLLQASIPKDASVIVACQKGLRWVPARLPLPPSLPPSLPACLPACSPARLPLHPASLSACAVAPAPAGTALDAAGWWGKAFAAGMVGQGVCSRASP